MKALLFGAMTALALVVGYKLAIAGTLTGELNVYYFVASCAVFFTAIVLSMLTAKHLP